MRRRGLLIVAAIIVVVLLACVAVAAIGVVSYLASGDLDIPYPDGPPPTPGVTP